MSTEDLAISPLYSYKENPRPFSSEYSMGKLLGAGTHSEVYICTHLVTGAQRAAKIYRSKLHALTHGSMEVLAAELNIVLALSHPNLLHTFEYFLEPHSVTIVSELCQGGDLMKTLKHKTRFNESRAATVMKQLFFAVRDLHKNRIAHRGLKPESILFESPGLNSNLKIVKFENAVRMDKTDFLSQQKGSLLLMSPEMISGNYTELCDEWSLGVLLYLMLSGVPPFEANTASEIVERIKTINYNVSKGVWTRISPDAIDLLRQLLAPEQKRITVDNAVYHPWIQRYVNPNESDSPVVREPQVEMEKFRRKSKLKEAASKFVQVQNVTNLDLTRLKDAIFVQDPKRTGHLTKESLLNIVSTVSFVSLTEQEVGNIIHTLDCDETGLLEYQLLFEEMERQKSLFSKEKLHEAVRLFSENGQANQVEIVETLKIFDMTENEVSSVIAEVTR